MTLATACVDLDGIGPVTISASEIGVCSLSFSHSTSPSTTPVLRLALMQLAEYARGKRTSFDLPLDLSSCTPFTRSVLAGCRRIAWGRVLSYGQLAEAIGRPTAARAVGGALGRNPVAIIVPCHRVVGGTSIGGFTGGLHHKHDLWRLEQIRWPQT
jgi:methylated-DNA-[protein]-cysteine S-methyltransferase